MAITFEKTPLEWNNAGAEPSTDLKTNGFVAGYKPAADTFNYQINNSSACLTELQTKLSGVDDDVTTLEGTVSELDQNAIRGIRGKGTLITPMSDKTVNITAASVGAAASSHNHSASNITSGTLPIERGGTGGTTASAARTSLGFSTATSLYSNSSGTHSTITLSDDISNYDSIGIYCFWESKDIYSARYYEFLGSPSTESLYNVRPAIRTSSEGDAGNGVVLSGYKITLNSNSITFATYTTNKSIYITSDSSTGSSEFYGRYLTNQIPYITKVVGYKY